MGYRHSGVQCLARVDHHAASSAPVVLRPPHSELLLPGAPRASSARRGLLIVAGDVSQLKVCRLFASPMRAGAAVVDVRHRNVQHFSLRDFFQADPAPAVLRPPHGELSLSFYRTASSSPLFHLVFVESSPDWARTSISFAYQANAFTNLATGERSQSLWRQESNLRSRDPKSRCPASKALRIA